MNIVKTRDELDKIATILKPSNFVEKYTSIKLSDYHKQMIDNFPKRTVYFNPSRSNCKRLISFYNACVHLSKMKDDDIIVVAKPSGWEEMNKEEFANYLLNEY